MTIILIDTHCHLEQSDYNEDRHAVIKRCKQQLKAVITSCANPKDLDLTMQLVKQYKGFVFASVSVHPEYIKDFGKEEITEYIKQIKTYKTWIVAIGETGLDYNWVREPVWQEKQKQLFIRLMALADQLRLPLVIHSRDATEEVVNILEQHAIKRVQMHMFTARRLLKQVIDNGWLVSVNTLLLRSKDVRKIVRDCPLSRLMLETDAPWLGIGKDGHIKPKDEVRNEPTAVRLVAEKIAEIKKIDVEDVDKQTTENAIDFFRLNI